MSGLARKILVAQLSMITSRMSERLQLVEGLRREHHRRVVLAPGLEGLDDVSLNARVLEEHPRFVDEERFENGGDLPVRDDGVGPMEDVEEQRFQKFRDTGSSSGSRSTGSGRTRSCPRRCRTEIRTGRLASIWRGGSRHVVPERVREHARACAAPGRRRRGSRSGGRDRVRSQDQAPAGPEP